MKNRVLLISGNYFPEPTGIGKFNSEMIDWLADHDYDCTVIATYPYYPYWKIQTAHTGKNKWFFKEKKLSPGGNTIKILRCPHYVPGNPTGMKRMLLDFSYFSSVFTRLLSLTGKKFDFIINVTPPISLGILAALYKRITKGRFLYHIQDLQVDVASDLKMIRSQRFINQLFKIERYILKKADRISTISVRMREKVSAKSGKNVYLFPNWADTKVIKPLTNRKELKLSFGFDPDIPVVLYSGSIGEKQGLEEILDVAGIFNKKNIPLQFVICGSGPYKNTLEISAHDRNLSNVTFLPLQPYELLNRFLNMADVHVVLQKANVADHVMPSKLTSILAVAGLCVVTANKGSGLYQMITDNNMGLVCPAEEINALFDTIQDALQNNHEQLCINARSYAEKFLSIDIVMQAYESNVMHF